MMFLKKCSPFFFRLYDIYNHCQVFRNRFLFSAIVSSRISEHFLLLSDFLKQIHRFSLTSFLTERKNTNMNTFLTLSGGKEIFRRSGKRGCKKTVCTVFLSKNAEDLF